MVYNIHCKPETTGNKFRILHQAVPPVGNSHYLKHNPSQTYRHLAYVSNTTNTKTSKTTFNRVTTL